MSQGHPWNPGDTVVAGIGQGYIQVTPLAARHLRRARRHRPQGGAASDAQAGRRAAAGIASRATGRRSDLTERSLHVVREGMWAVVNEAGGTAPQARLPDQRWQLAGKTGSSQVRRVSREQRERATSIAPSCRGNSGRTRCSSAYAPYDAPRYAVSVVVEHGNAGAAAAAPIARDIMMDTLQRDPGGRDALPGARSRCECRDDADQVRP